MLNSPLTNDLDEILHLSPGLWNDLRGCRLFLTGGTGFVGTWLVESLLFANNKLGLDLSVSVLSRDKDAFLSRNPHLALAPNLSFYSGDVRSFSFPSRKFTHLIHAATESSKKLNKEQGMIMHDVIVQGTIRALEFARYCEAKKFLFISSGAVYGHQGLNKSHISEDDFQRNRPILSSSPYAEGKREAEHICQIESNRNIDITIARGFTFVGPHLPQNAHFAIGNFIQNVLRKETILIKGDGTSIRSYLYPTDLVVWLLTILLSGKSGCAYNVGSEVAINMAELAQLLLKTVSPSTKIQIMKSPVCGKPPEQYVPSTARARKELGLTETVDLEVAIRRTIDWSQKTFF